MRLERGNLVRITDDEVMIAKLKEEGYEEVKEVAEGKDDDVAKVVEGKDDDVAEVVKEKATETAKEEEKADKEVKEVSGEKKATGRGRANNKK